MLRLRGRPILESRPPAAVSATDPKNNSHRSGTAKFQNSNAPRIELGCDTLVERSLAPVPPRRARFRPSGKPGETGVDCSARPTGEMPPGCQRGFPPPERRRCRRHDPPFEPLDCSVPERLGCSKETVAGRSISKPVSRMRCAVFVYLEGWSSVLLEDFSGQRGTISSMVQMGPPS